jgi:hypothetical protein
MNALAYRYVSGTLFALIAIFHAYRAAAALPAAVAGTAIPVWWSWVAAVFTALLAVWGFRARE